MPAETLTPQALDALRKLAFLDSDRVSGHQHLQETRKRAEQDALLESKKVAFERADQDLKKIRNERRAQEGAVQDTTTRVRRTEARLAGGQMTTPREIAAAQAEISQLHQSISDLEQHILELMLAEEEAQSQLGQCTKALADEQGPARVRMQRAAAEVTELETRLRTIDQERRAAALLIPADVRDRYRALFPRTAGRPLAFTLAGECGNCYAPLPGAAVQLIRSHTGVPSCPSCARLLISQG